MEIPTKEIQMRVFGYYTTEMPPVDSFKAKAYELIEQGLTDEQIEKLAQTWQCMNDSIQTQIINPIIEEGAKRN